MHRILGMASAAALALGLAHPAAAPDMPATNATYFDDARTAAADPYVLRDSASGYYYAYSTEGADRGYYFGIYRSADLVTWEKVPGGALPVDDPKQWGSDWFWAPEVYHNPATGLYYLFYTARSSANATRWFGLADFAEPCKIGVAVSRSPEGPFHNIAAQPIDYNPYDPGYHDVNRLMGPDQTQPPATLTEGETAPLGIYIPAIDPDVYFAPDGREYLYFSRNAYRDWVWDTDLNKYVEESNILAVELTSAWWNDPRGATMPSIVPRYVGANSGPGGPDGPRRDGWVQIIDYSHDKQAWENADVDDAQTSGAISTNRRWEEGSTTFEHRYTDASGRTRTLYYLTYSANNWESPYYGVGYAVADSPLGPWRKFAGNPIVSPNPAIGMYGPGHGGLALSPDGTEMYYVHHGRPTVGADQRRLYEERMVIDDFQLDAAGHPIVRIDQTTGDRPVPSGVAPYAITASPSALDLRRGQTATLSWAVASASGASLALGNPLNRVRATVADPQVATVQPDASGAGGTLVAQHPGRTTVTLIYQRETSGRGYFDVVDVGDGASGPVSATVSVAVTG
jgi:beta-xylosidase